MLPYQSVATGFAAASHNWKRSVSFHLPVPPSLYLISVNAFLLLFFSNGKGTCQTWGPASTYLPFSELPSNHCLSQGRSTRKTSSFSLPGPHDRMLCLTQFPQCSFALYIPSNSYSLTNILITNISY